MSDEEAARILTAHNAWRRGAEIEMLPPKLIGDAIDHAIAALIALASEAVA